MPKTWEEIREEISKWPDISPNKKKRKDYQSKYYKYELNIIFQKAEEWGISSDILEGVDTSKLLEIISPAKIAIRKNDRLGLIEVFSHLHEKVSDMRLNLKTARIQEIPVRKIINNGEEKYLLEVTDKQFPRIEASVKTKFSFTFVEEGPNLGTPTNGK